MYYKVTKLKDAIGLHKIYPNISVEVFEQRIRWALNDYGTPAISVINDQVEFCYLDFYKTLSSGFYGEQGFIRRIIKYNKEQVCVK